MLLIAMSFQSMHSGSRHRYASLVLNKDEYKALLKDHNAKFIKQKPAGKKPIVDKDTTTMQVEEEKAQFAYNNEQY